jgi:hypothetical protein
VVLLLIVGYVFHALGARVRFRRQSETPYRGTEFTEEQWNETFLESWCKTSAGMTHAIVLMMILVAVSVCAGYHIGHFERIHEDEQNRLNEVERNRISKEDRRIREEEHVQHIEQRCEKLRQDFSAVRPEDDIVRFWKVVPGLIHGSWECKIDVLPRLESLSSEQVTKALDYISLIIEQRRLLPGMRYGNSYYTDEVGWTRLISHRNSPNDRLALAVRLKGTTLTEYRSLPREIRLRFLILRALDRSEIEDTPEMRAALEYTATWREGDNDPNLITVRMMAIQLLARLDSLVESAD